MILMGDNVFNEPREIDDCDLEITFGTESELTRIFYQKVYAGIQSNHQTV